MGFKAVYTGIRCPDMEQEMESKEPWLKCRYIIALFGHLISFFSSSSRMNMSVGIVAMVSNPASATKTEAESCPVLLINSTSDGNSSERAGVLDWSPAIQGHILGSYFLIYFIVQIPFAKLVERYGSRWFIIWGTALAAVSTLAIPPASSLHAYAVIICQILRATGQVVYPACLSVMTVNWFPKMEMGSVYTFMISGISAGVFIGSIVSGFICRSMLLGGWPSAFYVFGIVGLMLSAATVFFMHETPRDHPKISPAEFQYIMSNQEKLLSRRRPDTPWRKVFKSVPVYAAAIGLFGQLWMLTQLAVVHTIFLGTVLHYPIEENGFLSASPFLLMCICSLTSSWLSSVMTRKKYASIDHIRKFWNSVACLGCSLCFLGVYFAGCNRSWSICCLIISGGFCGFGMSGSWIVSADMSPTFTASIYSICSTFACVSQFILPLVVGYLTDGMQTLQQWNKVFLITSGIVMASGVIFLACGSAEIQPWNDVEHAVKQDRVETTRIKL